MPAWVLPAAMAGAQLGGDLLSMFGPQPDYQGGSAIGRPEWWQMQGPLTGAFGASQSFGQQITPEYMAQLRNAMSGNMGLDPAALNMMGGRVKQQMAPQFAMQQDALRSSFSPRLAGSGASASAMQNLLSGQGQQMTGAQTDINIQDLLSRFNMMGQGMSQFGQLQGQNQAQQLGWANQINRWLGM